MLNTALRVTLLLFRFFFRTKYSSNFAWTIKES